MTKDAGVALDMAAHHELGMPFGELAQARLGETIEAFGAEADMSAVALTYEALTRARIRP